MVAPIQQINPKAANTFSYHFICERKMALPRSLISQAKNRVDGEVYILVLSLLLIK